MTTGQRWINHEWLAEVAFALAWMAGGSTGVVIFKTLIWVVTYALLFWYIARYPLVPLRAGILLLVSMMIALPYSITARPPAFSDLLYTLTFIIIVKAESGCYRWLLPLVPSVALLCVPSIIVFYIGRQSDLAQIVAGMICYSALVLVLWETIGAVWQAEKPKYS